MEKKMFFSLCMLMFISACTTEYQENGAKNQENNNISLGGFCGRSTFESCKGDSDCETGGCSGQICQSEKEEKAITTCEWRECYDDEVFNVNCRCINNQCQWSK